MMPDISKNKEMVLVFGTFDGLHDGHRYFLREAKKHGSKLVAAVSSDEVVKQLKGAPPLYSLSKRIENLAGERLVDEVVAGDTKMNSWEIIQKIKPDVICLGYDQSDLKAALEKDIALFGRPIELVTIESHEPNTLHSSLLNKKRRLGL